MNVLHLGSTILVLSMTAACASRTSPATVAATPPRTTVAAASKQAPDDVFGQVGPEKRKLLASALVSSKGGACWNAIRHAPIIAETAAEDGTPYIAPIDLKIDLDGDGTPDPVVEVDRDGKNVRYELYVTRGQCARHLGTAKVEGTIKGVLGKANGMRTLEVIGEGEGEQKHGELVFDGKHWSVTKRWTTPLK
jgi:hypothetical protein